LPFFFNFEGPLKEEIVRENIGIYADYTNPGELAEKMDYYANNITLLRAMGKSARELAESRYNRKKILKELSAYITT
jgi:glycosyltransferase involved in cell wall biosynthesis